MKYTKEDIYNLVEEEDVEFIRLQFTDMFGVMKNVAVTVNQLDKILDNKCTFDGSMIDGFSRVEESDMYLCPDLDTFTIFPWRPQQGKVARFICNVKRVDGTDFEGDPRHVLIKAVEDAKEMGYDFVVGPECEFFLFHTDDNGNPTTVTHEKAGYFDLGPTDRGENVRRDMVLNLEDMGFNVMASHHELAPGQHEIDFEADNALKTADNIMTFKLAVKSVAKRHGLHATFMPKPTSGVNGSGMHIQMQLFKDGKNIFSDENDKNGLSKEAYAFLAGIIKHIKGMTVITNPLVNSYKRLVPGYEAPIYIAWSTKSRSPLIRISDLRGEETKIELRCPDPAANPYLTLAVCLQAGLDGIKNNLEPMAPVDENIRKMDEDEMAELGIEQLPETLKDAIIKFEEDDFVKEIVGAHISKNYIKAKKNEWKQYRSQITEWEIDKYLHKF